MMRWKEVKYRDRDVRVRTAFLLFPKEINGITRWLEYATWSEKYSHSWDGSYWEEIEWLDVSDSEKE